MSRLELRRAFGRRRRVGVAAAALPLLAVAGLGAVGTAPAGAATAKLAQAQQQINKYLPSPKKIVQNVPLKHTPTKGKVLISLISNEPGGGAYYPALEAATKAAGWTYKTVTYTNTDAASIAQAYATALQQHPTAVTMAGFPQTMIGTTNIKAYQAAHVPIILVGDAGVKTNTVVKGTPGGPPTDVLSGQLEADELAVNSKGKGSAVVVSLTAYPLMVIQKNAFLKQTKKVCPKCKTNVLSLTLTEVNGGQANSTIVSALKSHPTAKYLVILDAPIADGWAEALKAAGMTNIKVEGGGMDKTAASQVKLGRAFAFTPYGQDVAAQGAIDLALRFSETMPTNHNNDLLPMQVLTPKNIGTITTWQFPASSLQQYEKLWKVPTTGNTG
ncbi:MAG TPA: hypothetical protein VHB02_13180 [Acidimicrobiales bacterium]|nr:hypothetical protein [Acidimicrobiales bacterium]